MLCNRIPQSEKKDIQMYVYIEKKKLFSSTLNTVCVMEIFPTTTLSVCVISINITYLVIEYWSVQLYPQI